LKDFFLWRQKHPQHFLDKKKVQLDVAAVRGVLQSQLAERKLLREALGNLIMFLLPAS